MMKLGATTRNADPKLMAWDGDWWGLRVGQATHLDGISEWAAENTVGLIYLLVDTVAEAQAAEERGFRLMDCRLTLDRPTAVCGSGARLAKAEDLAPVKEIARTAFQGLTRFYNDPRLDEGRCDELYGEWARSQCAGGAEIVLVCDRDEKVAGFVSVNRSSEEEASISLIAVHAEMKGRGVGADLVSSAVNWARGQGSKRMTVVTQGGNVSAQRLFQRAGFRTSRVQYWMHRWYQ